MEFGEKREITCCPGARGQSRGDTAVPGAAGRRRDTRLRRGDHRDPISSLREERGSQGPTATSLCDHGEK
ncbi:hypothetical protein F7725_027300 [Dissostichus mawsoni]|uniref:Uncharacterized protein n=1 Tax=Dissostichus mawsoni TaxID=36200 RepID=A0A7J5XCH2_DISMA|nr:hypothetical protein F7725_027300 [Dissostichus mawsoni]